MNTNLEESKRLLREAQVVKERVNNYLKHNPTAESSIKRLRDEMKLLLMESQVYATLAGLEGSQNYFNK